MTHPDLSKLSSRMRYAADVLEEFNTDHPNQYTADGWWRPSDLRKEAEHVEAEEREEAEKNAVVGGLARELLAGQSLCFPKREDLKSWDSASNALRANCLSIAEALIESGWHKECM